MANTYMIYVETYGRLQSGATLHRNDYEKIDERGKLALSLAAQDAKLNTPMRSKSDFEEQIKEFLEETE